MLNDADVAIIELKDKMFKFKRCNTGYYIKREVKVFLTDSVRAEIKKINDY